MFLSECVSMFDLCSRQFDDWTVLCRDFDRSGEYYLCKCKCGSVKSISARNLISGISKRCRSCSNHQRWIDKVSVLINTRIGEWLVLGIDETCLGGHNGGRLICRCSCGRIQSVSYADLKRGQSRRCKECANECVVAFHHNRRKDLIGEVFGHWHVLQLDDTVVRNARGNPVLRYWCQCDLCGEIRLVNSTALTGGHSTRCYKCSAGRSRMEELVETLFNEIGARVESQVSFDDLIGLNGGLLSYDFGVYDDRDTLLCLVECQGRQHYEPVGLFGGEEKFRVQQVHDDLKRAYAKSMHVPLLEIPYVYDTYEKLKEFFLQHGFGSWDMYLEHGSFSWMSCNT